MRLLLNLKLNIMREEIYKISKFYKNPIIWMVKAIVNM